jgi:hypothetical protein
VTFEGTRLVDGDAKAAVARAGVGHSGLRKLAARFTLSKPDFRERRNGRGRADRLEI